MALSALWIVMWGETVGGCTTCCLCSCERRSISHNMCLNLTYWLCDLLPRNRHCWIHLHIQKRGEKNSNVCTLRAPARLKGTFKGNHKIKWASIESSWSKVDKTRRRSIALFGSALRWVQQMGRLVVWWGANVSKRSAFKSQLKDFCFCRRRPDLAAELRGKQHGSTLMFSWKFLLPDVPPKGSF